MQPIERSTEQVPPQPITIADILNAFGAAAELVRRAKQGVPYAVQAAVRQITDFLARLDPQVAVIIDGQDYSPYLELQLLLIDALIPQPDAATVQELERAVEVQAQVLGVLHPPHKLPHALRPARDLIHQALADDQTIWEKVHKQLLDTLAITTVEKDPSTYFAIQHLLGITFAHRLKGDRAVNLISAYRCFTLVLPGR